MQYAPIEHRGASGSLFTPAPSGSAAWSLTSVSSDAGWKLANGSPKREYESEYTGLLVVAARDVFWKESILRIIKLIRKGEDEAGGSTRARLPWLCGPVPA